MLENNEEKDNGKIPGHIFYNIHKAFARKDYKKLEYIMENMKRFYEGEAFNQEFLKTILAPMEIPRELINMGIDLNVVSVDFEEQINFTIKTTFRAFRDTLDKDTEILKKVNSFLR